MDKPEQNEEERRIRVALILIKVLLGCFFISSLFISALPWTGIIKLNRDGLNPDQGLQTIFLIFVPVLALAGFALTKLAFKAAQKGSDSSSLAVRLQKFNSFYMLALVCFEVISILGLVNYMTSADANSSLVFGVISLGCMIFALPKGDQIKSLI